MSIFKPTISQVSKGAEGKIFFIYGTNRTGKTSNAVKLPKPFVIACEPGLNSIPGIPYKRVTKWLDIRRTVDEFVEEVEEARKHYSTIIIDGVDSFSSFADRYICEVYKVRSIGEGNNGYGLWSVFGQEMRQQITRLSNLGFTVVFLGHENTVKEKIGNKDFETKVPSGDRRAWQTILDFSDIIGYASIDDVDKLANLYIGKSPYFRAGSRFKNMPDVIEEWDFDKLSDALDKAIGITEKETGISAISPEKAREQLKVEVTPLETIKEEIKKFVGLMSQSDPNLLEYASILKNILGSDVVGADGKLNFSVNNATEEDRAILETLVLDLKKSKGVKLAQKNNP